MTSGGIDQPMDLAEVQRKAAKIRMDVIKMLAEAGSGHPGGSLSAADLATVLLFGGEMNHRPAEPRWPGRDRMVLSKGHGVPVWYAALAHAGYFPREELLQLRKLGSQLQGHPDRVIMSAMEASTGSLGQGLSVALGMALASQAEGNPYRVYCLIGDGESQEGQIWEAAMAAPKFKLDNLCVILDHNRAQIDGYVEDVMPIEPVVAKWSAFNWHVIQIDGHDLEEIHFAFKRARQAKGKPTLIVAETVKGRGVSFMEDQVDWHGRAPTAEQARQALAELEAALAAE